MSIRQLSLEADVDSPLLRFDYGTDPNNVQTFDRDSIYGCKCDPGFEGYDCSQRTLRRVCQCGGAVMHSVAVDTNRQWIYVMNGYVESCPRGDDPTTQGQVDEVQLLKCVATSGTFQLLYRTSVSPDIPFDATPSVLKSILVAAFGFDDVVVEYSTGVTACSPVGVSTAAQNVIKLSFPLDHGDLPPLLADATSLRLSTLQLGTIVVAVDGATIDAFASQKGTKENALCANKGTCNYETGQCICASGYGSSDGRGNAGTRGDCGFILPRVAAAAI